MLGQVRPDERRLVGQAAAVAALGGAGGAMAGSGADALFLAHVGSQHLGGALAASSLLVAVVLAVVGGLADRVDRRKLLAGAAAAASAGAAALAIAASAAPAVAGVVGLVVVKQLQAAVDLGFWVVVAERLDARQARRLVPRFAAAQGVGIAAGALLVVPLAHLGMGAVLGAGALCYAGAALLARRLEVGRRVGAVAGSSLRNIAALGSTWRASLEAARRSALAIELAVVVAIAGAFASLAFYTMGSAAAAEVGGDRELAQFLGTMRAATQVVTLAAQLVIVPRLLERTGIAVALVIAPMAAVVFAGGYELSGALAAAVAVQAQARLLDASVQTPAEKLALGLVPVELRGRVGGFIDGTAKRAGAIAGGLLALALTGWPRALGGVMVVVAFAWLWLAVRLQRRLPALAVAALAAPRSDGDVGALADPRTVALVERDLAGPGAARAAEILVRLYQRGRGDPVPALVGAVVSASTTATARPVIADALVGCVERGSAARPALAGSLALWARDHAADPSAEAVIRAAGLLGAGIGAAMISTDEPAGVMTVPGSPNARGKSSLGAMGVLEAVPGAVGAAARIASARITSDAAAVSALLDDALDETAPPLRRLAVREARAELLRALGAGDASATDAGRRLLRAIRRVRGDDDADVAAHALGLDAVAELATRVGGSKGAEWILLRGDLVELARRHGDRRIDPTRQPAPPPVAAAALRLLGELGDPAFFASPDDAPAGTREDIRLLVHALGDRDDDVRDAAEEALRGLGPRAAGELVDAAAFGRRAGRDRALALLRELPVTDAALDAMIAAELHTLDRTVIRVGVLAELGPRGVVGRRLEERAREIGATVLLLLAARHRGAALAACARLWRHAPDVETRARALEILDAALPRATAVRVVGALDDGHAEARAAAAAERLDDVLPDRDQAIRAELGGGDRLSRALVVHALGATGRAQYRDQIASAARDAARDLSPLALLRRITGVEDDEAEDDVPTQVETLLLLGNVPLLAGLTTRQLAELAEAARWEDLEPGQVVVAAGEIIDALLVVASGSLRIDDPESPRIIAAGTALDDLAVVAPTPALAPVVAAEPTRLLRLPRVDFEELVDDVPGLAAAVCRVLGTRARR